MSARGNQEKGIALIIVIAVMIVVSLGILALTNGVGNMQRSAVSFGRADVSYSAATTGLSVARAYIKGLSYETDAKSSLDGTVNGATYDVTIAVDGVPTPPGSPILKTVTTVVDGENVTYNLEMWTKTYKVTSLGECGQAKRNLSYKLVVNKIKKISETTEYSIAYDVLAGGDLNLSGQSNFGKVHTNNNFSGSGNAAVQSATASGAANLSGKFQQNYDDVVTEGVPQMPMPEVNVAALLSDPTKVYVNNGDLSLSGQKTNTDLDAITDGRKIVYVQNGDLKISGQVSLDGYIFVVDGLVDLSGQTTLSNSFIYAGWTGDVSAIKLSGQTNFTGALVAKGKITGSGQFTYSQTNNATVETYLTQTVTINEVTTTLEEKQVRDLEA